MSRLCRDASVGETGLRTYQDESSAQRAHPVACRIEAGRGQRPLHDCRRHRVRHSFATDIAMSVDRTKRGSRTQTGPGDPRRPCTGRICPCRRTRRYEGLAHHRPPAIADADEETPPFDTDVTDPQRSELGSPEPCANPQQDKGPVSSSDQRVRQSADESPQLGSPERRRGMRKGAKVALGSGSSDLDGEVGGR